MYLDFEGLASRDHAFVSYDEVHYVNTSVPHYEDLDFRFVLWPSDHKLPVYFWKYV